MKTKILYFKFTKKSLESQERSSKSKKNYENIFNNILNGNKKDKLFENKGGTIERKKNKIKCISKINNLNFQRGVSKTIKNEGYEDKKNEEQVRNSLSNNTNEKKFNEKDQKIKNLDKKDLINPIDEYINNSNLEKSKNLKINLVKPNTLEKLTLDNHIVSWNNNSKDTKNKNVEKNFKKKNSLMKYKMNNLKYKRKREKELNKKDKNKKKDVSKIIINNMKKYELSQIDNSLNVNRTNLKSKNGMSIKKIKDNKNKKIERVKTESKRFSSCEPKNIIFKNPKKNQFNNFLNKITITNDNINESAKLKKKKNNINYTVNNNTKSKKLILNNTNSNINININITNINDKNISKKETDFDKKNIKSNLESENNNYNNNITTVNIINNSNAKKKLNDYRLLFYNHSKKEKYTPYLNKINSKGIEIQSININLGEETDDEFNKVKLKNDPNNNNEIKKKEIENEKKEVQSEYEHFRDFEDFWSNRSQTSFSCKSGFTASRKIRSLSRERDKIKLLNNYQKNNEHDIERIGDKLLNIVNNFHNNSGIYNMKKNRKSLNGIRKKYKINKNYKNNITEDEKKKKVRKKKY